MHETTARLIAARQDAYEVLSTTDALARQDWSPKATAHRNALLDLMQALDDVMILDRYPVNPDAPEEGTDIRATFVVDADSLPLTPDLPAAEYHRRYQAHFAQPDDVIKALRQELYNLEDENALTVRDRGEVAGRLARTITEIASR